MGSENTIKYLVSLSLIIFLRILPTPFPNFDPIIAFLMPFSKGYGKKAGFIFGFFALISFDFISGRVGMWTLYCGLAYGAIGIFAAKLLKKRKNNRKNYGIVAILSIIVYDVITAFLFGLEFHQSLPTTFFGQIPFTLYHLISGVSFSLIFSPIIYTQIVKNKALSVERAKLFFKDMLNYMMEG